MAKRPLFKHRSTLVLLSFGVVAPKVLRRDIPRHPIREEELLDFFSKCRRVLRFSIEVRPYVSLRTDSARREVRRALGILAVFYALLGRAFPHTLNPTMTKTQQKLARQGTIVLNFGGKALTALLRILLLSVAVVFEGVSRVFLFLDDIIADDIRETERAAKQEPNSRSITAMPNKSDRISPEPAYVRAASAALARVTGAGN